MNECFKCGALGDKVRLYDAISNKGIVKICGDCNALERLPIIKKPTDNQIEDSQRQKSVRDMLTGMNRGKALAGREMSLRELVDKNLKERREKLPSDLIDNFNWTIQRIRRARKITREQFSKGIGESEATIRMVENGILPGNDYRIINKIEGYLGVTLRKPGSSGFPDTRVEEKPIRRFQEVSSEIKVPPKRFSLNRETEDKLKISDLRDMKKKKEEEKKPIDSWEEEYSEDDEKFLDKKDEDEFFDDEEDI
jgi:ribosome-binding protein aMBF1 (putative translation factor)